MSNFNDFFGGSSGGTSRMPSIDPLALGAGAFNLMNLGNLLEGFLGDGDYIELPPNSGSDLEYYDNTDTLQWSVAKSDLDASVDRWGGFMNDLTDELIYISGVDTSTSPHTYYLASVNQAGTLVNIGSGQPAIGFNIGVVDYWNLQASSNGSSLIRRDSDGAGNIFLNMTQTGGMEEMEIDITDGSIATDVVVPRGTGALQSRLSLKTGSGIYVSAATSTTEYLEVQIFDTSAFYGLTRIPFDHGVYSTTQVKIIQWKGYLAGVAESGNNMSGQRFWSSSNFNAFVDEIKALYS